MLKRSTKTATVVDNKRHKEGTFRISIEIKRAGKIKVERKISSFLVHYPLKEEIAIGKKVKIAPCAPVSKQKKWEILEVI